VPKILLIRHIRSKKLQFQNIRCVVLKIEVTKYMSVIVHPKSQT